MEDLIIKGMQKLWGNKIGKLNLSNLVSLIKYKAESQGKIFYQIDRWFPSSKQCYNCKNVKSKLKLSERTYNCLECGYKKDRDINASDNILLEGIMDLLKKYSIEMDYSAIENLLKKKVSI